MNLESLYLRLPFFCQNAICSLYGARLIHRRYGNVYKTLERDIFERETWTTEQLHNLACKRIQAIVQHAAEHVPYYRRMFAELAIDPKDIRAPKDIAALPILDKQTVQENLADFHSEIKDQMPHSTVHTSGTTGAGLIFPMTLRSEQEQWATWWRYRKRFGLDRKTWYAHFYGKSIVPFKQSKPPFWRVNRPGHQIFFSGYHMNMRNLPYYVEELNRRQPPWIQGYPSYLALLSAFMLEKEYELNYKPKTVTISAESLLPQQKLIIEKAFGVPCRQHYGLVEAVANISECPEGNLHIDEDYGYVEFIPIEGYSYEIIGTGYTNYAFPLIRYDTGDVAELVSPEKKCPCGRPGRLVKSIDGRKEDFVVTPDGRRIGRMDHIFKGMIHIKECQIFQDCFDRVVFRVVRGEKYSREDEQMLLDEAAKRLGDQIKVEIKHVEAIERTAGNKLRFVISKIPGSQIQSPGGDN